MILFDNVDDSLKPQMIQVRSDLNTSSNAPETPPPYSSSEQINSMQTTDHEPVEGEQAGRHGQPRDKSSRRRKIIRRSLTGLCLMIIWILMAIIGPIISRKAGYIDTFVSLRFVRCTITNSFVEGKGARHSECTGNTALINPYEYR